MTETTAPDTATTSTGPAPGTVAWFQIGTDDPAGAREFYGGLFGWRTEDVDMPGGGTYTVLTPADADRDRAHGGVLELPAGQLTLGGGRPWWHPVFAVEDCDATVRAAERLGGRVRREPVTTRFGRHAVLVDNQGAVFAIIDVETTSE